MQVDQPSPAVTHAVEVHLRIQYQIFVIAENCLHLSLEPGWLKYLSQYQAKIAPQVAELRRFLAAKAPGLGTPQGGKIDEAMRKAKRKRVEQRRDVNASNIGHFNAPLEAQGEGVGGADRADEEGAPFQG